MSTLSQFLGGGKRPATSVVNYFSGGGVLSSGVVAGKAYLSGALTANTYKEVVSVTGAGEIAFAAAGANDATPRQVGLKLVIDGVTVFDAVSSVVSGANQGMFLGMKEGAYAMPTVLFNESFSVEVKSTLTETDKVSAHLSYTLF